MRILMLNNEFPPLGGGTGTVNQTLLQHFAQSEELEIDLITSALGRAYEETNLSKNVRICYVPVNNKNIHHSSNRELIVYAMRALRLAIQRHRARAYDLIFAFSALPAGAVALALHFFLKRPYLVRVCGPDIPGFEQRYGALYPLLTPIIRATWHQADKVIAKCRQEAEMIQAVDRNVDVTLIPNGVDLVRFQPRANGFSKTPLRVLCVGRLIKRKGQQHLIKAIQQLRDEGHAITLNLVGTGDEESAYRQQVQQAELQSVVKFAGFVPRERMPEVYTNADVFVLPSYNEGMSVATLEAMAAGLPIVLTRTGGTDELVDERVNGLTFNWADVSTLTNHLRVLIQNHTLVQQMGKASREKALGFSWKKVASSYLRLFASYKD